MHRDPLLYVWDPLSCTYSYVRPDGHTSHEATCPVAVLLHRCQSATYSIVLLHPDDAANIACTHQAITRVRFDVVHSALAFCRHGNYWKPVAFRKHFGVKVRTRDEPGANAPDRWQQCRQEDRPERRRRKTRPAGDRSRSPRAGDKDERGRGRPNKSRLALLRPPRRAAARSRRLQQPQPPQRIGVRRGQPAGTRCTCYPRVRS